MSMPMPFGSTMEQWRSPQASLRSETRIGKTAKTAVDKPSVWNRGKVRFADDLMNAKFTHFSSHVRFTDETSKCACICILHEFHFSRITDDS
jgi:hypothetical protein